MRTERQLREAAARHFEVQADKLYLSIQQRLTNYRYRCHDELRACDLTVMVLADSFDFYEYRLNSGKRRVDLLVVQKHNSVVPLRTICLSDSSEYQPGALPHIERDGRQRRNRDEVALFVSRLLLGSESAEQELAAMHPRTRQRYLKRRNEYLRPKVGRPWAS